jgi:acetylornithine deacetylase
MRGVAAHGSRTDLGIDAIVRMGHVLVALEQHDDRLQSGRHHPLAGTGSVHASLIEGGQELSSFPARCQLTGERRTIPGETATDVERELRELAGEATVRVIASRDPTRHPSSTRSSNSSHESPASHRSSACPRWS